MGNVNMEASQINYRGGEKKMSVEEALKNTSGEAAAIAQLQTDVLNLNSNKANQITIAPFFSAEASYDPGDLVYYNGLTYRCVNAHEGEWDADDFAATTIANELDALKSGLTDYHINTAYDTYGDIVMVHYRDNVTVTDGVVYPITLPSRNLTTHPLFFIATANFGWNFDIQLIASLAIIDGVTKLKLEVQSEGQAYSGTVTVNVHGVYVQES